jgi:HSF-type DNA-binding
MSIPHSAFSNCIPKNPLKMVEILSDDECSAMIGWLWHGKGFIIKDKKRFAEEVLPRYFKKSKFTSFTRKLNRW